MTLDQIVDISIIKEMLPHRDPFLFVDRVVEFKSNETITTEKELLPDMVFFAGHFPGTPIMPGVLTTEALAQACGLLLGLTWKEKPELKGNVGSMLFLVNVNMKYTSPAVPNETLILKAALKKKFGGLFMFDVSAQVKDRLIGKGSISLGAQK
ncbi:MAG: 3-hydroxyacyl-[acyl-carrier-protein] dehydratase FabZ [Deltaproteobacteria bacterium]|nr:3-hydroxyacyl-[acyl-carrier-protein] dehydratase FabZ [Deltaproteobacteria bacterium]